MKTAILAILVMFGSMETAYASSGMTELCNKLRRSGYARELPQTRSLCVRGAPAASADQLSFAFYEILRAHDLAITADKMLKLEDLAHAVNSVSRRRIISEMYEAHSNYLQGCTSSVCPRF